VRTVSPRTIAVLGGGGALGSGLARRFAHAGHRVIVGSRDPARTLREGGDFGGAVTVAAHEEAASAADIAFLTVPFAGQALVLTAVAQPLAGKILVDTTVPLVPPKVGRVQLPAQGSAALIAQGLVGDRVRVVSALQNVGAAHLAHVADDIDCDVLVCGDHAEARAEVIALIGEIGLRGYHAGPLANAAAAEALTSVLISMNRFYKSDRAGIRITGI
jgi:NADPH-dependent F420 reductase